MQYNTKATAQSGNAYVEAVRRKRLVSPVSFNHGQGTATLRDGVWVQTSTL
jgi:hypothetical protein